MALAGQQKLGPYRLLNLIKTGQTSQVWTAIKDATQQRVALKTLLSDFQSQKEHLAYIRNEYAVGKALDHPNVIKTLDFGQERSLPYLVMELFNYPNMKDILVRAEVRESIAFLVPRMIERAAEGLAHVHEKGFIHRDVKPDNFLVSDRGEIRLIDFALAEKKKTGLAKLFGGKSKVIVGTRSYMSPEQIRKLPLDERADIYSFACTIFHLMAGHPPYTAPTSNELLQKHIAAAIPSLEVSQKNVTPEFAALLRRCISKKPEQRPESMARFLQEFRALSVFKVPPSVPPGFDEAETASSQRG